MTKKPRRALPRMGPRHLFKNEGIHCIVDGQFGSTGKGALCAWLAGLAAKASFWVEGSIYSGGPNSGHTFYHEGEKHVLKQLPTTAVALSLIEDKPQIAYLSAGAVIDPEILFEEARRYPRVKIFVDPNAAVIDAADKAEEGTGTIAEVAGTRSGTGAALARKIRRDPTAIWGGNTYPDRPENVTTNNHFLKPEQNFYFLEVSQGFSLGINSHFYPKVTSRECTVMQGLADARIAPRHLVRTFMSIRTYPIRVGNVDGYSSGDWYSDQTELTWDDLGVEAEKTTVTQRIRRVADFSSIQLEDALRANDPDWVFINFINYIKSIGEQDAFIETIREIGERHSKRFGVIGGYGPTSADIRLIG